MASNASKVTGNAVYTPKNTHTSRRQRHEYIRQHAMANVFFKLVHLARLGRPGHWVLHHENLYSTEVDTRPSWRKQHKEIRVPGSSKLIWVGKGATPNFQNISFWGAKSSDLDQKIEQVKAGNVQPRFTKEELQTLKALEQQMGHSFHTQLADQKTKLAQNRESVLNVLFELAGLGRAGQWILHHEELYHTLIDTRAQSRTAEEQAQSVAIRGTMHTSTGGLWGERVTVAYELVWAGTGPPPDFANDFAYWENKLADLNEKLRQVEEGRVQPHFTAAELRALEANSDVFPRHRKPIQPIQSPEAKAAEKSLADAKRRVVVLLGDLWDAGLAGKWLLHFENLYVPAYDTRCREHLNRSDGDDGDDGDGLPSLPNYITLLEPDSGLHFDSRCHRQPTQPVTADLGSMAYWTETIARLRTLRDDVTAGRLVEHHFTPEERMHMELLDRKLQDGLERHMAMGESDPAPGSVQAWLDTAKDMAALPARTASIGHVGVSQVQSGAGARKRKQPMDDDEERPVERSKQRQRPQKRPRRRQENRVAAMQRPPPRRAWAVSEANKPPRRSARIAALQARR